MDQITIFGFSIEWALEKIQLPIKNITLFFKKKIMIEKKKKKKDEQPPHKKNLVTQTEL